jgi:two-component system response regulator YesN
MLEVKEGPSGRLEIVMRYRVLVADDEYMIRRGIIKLLGKYSDLEVVAEAEDGEEALALAEKISLDIVFVDINMPFLNGLQFIEKLKQIQPGVIVNIITGYDKFEYVRQALRLEVFEYILKPLNEKNFEETIYRIIETLEKRNSEEKYLRWAKSTLGRSKNGLIENFFLQCIKQDYSKEKRKEELEYLGLSQYPSFSMHLFHFEQLENADIRKHWEDNLIYYSAENIARELFEPFGPVTAFCGKGHLAVILKTESEELPEDQLLEYQKAVERYLPVKVLSVHQSGKDPDQMPFLYERLLEQLQELMSYPSIIKKVKQFIQNNYYREELSLLEAAEYVNLSPQHLSRIFKNKMGITFVDYLTQVRIGKAIELFEDEDLKMYEIAEKVGYTTQHYFSSVFKKELGISPIDYKSNKKKLIFK